MRAFLEFVVERLTDRPEEAVIREDLRGETRRFVLELPSTEVGKIIGKQGHTIQAIRSLLVAAASREGQRVAFEIVEPGEA